MSDSDDYMPACENEDSSSTCPCPTPDDVQSDDVLSEDDVHIDNSNSDSTDRASNFDLPSRLVISINGFLMPESLLAGLHLDDPENSARKFWHRFYERLQYIDMSNSKCFYLNHSIIAEIRKEQKLALCFDFDEVYFGNTINKRTTDIEDGSYSVIFFAVTGKRDALDLKREKKKFRARRIADCLLTVFTHVKSFHFLENIYAVVMDGLAANKLAMGLMKRKLSEYEDEVWDNFKLPPTPIILDYSHLRRTIETSFDSLIDL